ncbi:MAG: glycoside hydrolase family 127 protein [Microcella sp.]|uniref:glycoside hydrolase family 127 protein n=1 Tax=Microcella sp. TaxID=1913979 RepID=UPI0024CA41E4|nr:beta-L-arabinofuranosidase domain-containing protein [Microcella sp.]UYN83163.1 MAG: glycoside hydrolase family 127 protein [Microcella sp.]
MPTTKQGRSGRTGSNATVRFSSGFWAGVQRRIGETTVPAMGNDLRDDSVSPAWRNFRIAAGLDEGAHAGPPFLDGDFYKWLEAALNEYEVRPTDALKSMIDESVELIASVQRDDGYLHTPTLIASRTAEGALALADRFHFETYNLGHLISVGVRHFEVTGEHSLLTVARAAAGFLQHLADDKPLELARSAICPSHYMAVIELYRATGEDQYLRLAEKFVEVRDDFQGGDDNQDRLPVREQKTVAGHAVRANYLYAGLADLVNETDDDELEAVLVGLWNDVVDTKLYITGGCGALYDGASPYGFPWQSEISRVHQSYGRPYELPNTTAHNETCANIGMIFWSERMLALTGEARYADVIERIAYNSLLSGVSLAGTEFFYTNPLRQVRELPFALRMPGDTNLRPIPDPPPSDARLRQRYMSCFCCPPNVARVLTRFHERAAAVTSDGVRFTLYGGSTVDAELEPGARVRLTEVSDYPWNGTVTVTVDEAPDRDLRVELRVPGWVTGATVRVNDEVPTAVESSTYAVLERRWQAGDRIVLELPMPARVLRGHRLAEDVTNQVAVVRGPLVYAVESHDLPEGLRVEQVGLRRSAVFSPITVDVAGHELVALEGTAVALPPAGTELYSDVPHDAVDEFAVRLIPYFAWGNRGPSEMSVWMPVVWS